MSNNELALYQGSLVTISQEPIKIKPSPYGKAAKKFREAMLADSSFLFDGENLPPKQAKRAKPVDHKFHDVINRKLYCTQCGEPERDIIEYRSCKPSMIYMGNPQGLGPKGAIKKVVSSSGIESIFIMRDLWEYLDLNVGSYKGPLWPDTNEVVPLSSPYHPEAMMFEQVRAKRRREQESHARFNAQMDQMERDAAKTALLAPAMAIPLFHEEPIHERLMPYRVPV